MYGTAFLKNILQHKNDIDIFNISLIYSKETKFKRESFLFLLYHGAFTNNLGYWCFTEHSLGNISDSQRQMENQLLFGLLRNILKSHSLSKKSYFNKLKSETWSGYRASYSNGQADRHTGDSLSHASFHGEQIIIC